MIGDRGEVRPRCGDLAPAMDESDPDDAMTAECQWFDIEPGELAECPWGQDVAAGLVPGDRSFLDERDLMAGPRQQIGDRGSGGTTADDEDVGVQRCRRQPAAEPSTGSGPTGATSTSPNASPSGDVKSYSPDSTASKTGDSGEHQVSNSSANSSLVGSAPPSV